MLGNLKDNFEKQNFEEIKINEFDELEQFILHKLFMIGATVDNNLKISETLNGPLFSKNEKDIFAFIKAFKKKLSIFIAIYFLSTIVADQIASAIFLLSTKASPLYFQTLP